MRCIKFWLLVSSLTLLPCTVLLGQPYQAPIIDAHGHLGASFNWKIMVEAMDSNNVTQRTVMARYYPGSEGPRDLPGSDEDAVQLAERYPGGFFPLVGMQRPLLTGSHKWRSPDREVDRLIEQDGVLFPDMKALYEEFPDRFMLGMDVAHAPGNNPQNYSRRVNRFRGLLGQLKPETAKKFAETNAIRIFKLGSTNTR